MFIRKVLLSNILIIANSVYHNAFATTFKIATVAPDGSFWMQLMREGTREVKQQTGDRVKFKFYPGGVMGSQDTVQKKCALGKCRMAMLRQDHRNAQ